MTRLRFDAPAHSPHYQYVVRGKTYGGGDEGEFPKDVAAALLADPNVPVSVVKAPVVIEGADKKEVESK
jgi:hypothetical protein